MSALPVLTTREDRARARRSRVRRSIAISTVSTIVVIGGATTLVLTSSGWPTFKRVFLSGHYFNLSFSSVLSGFWLDIRLFLIVEVAVLALGMAIALLRTVRLPLLFPVRMLAVVFVDVMRGVPLIILIYLIGFGVPTLNPNGLNDANVLGGIALALCYSAYVSEVFRAGILSIHPSQAGAALALGLTRWQALRDVVIPQAVRNVVPPLLNDFISLQKDVALVSIIGTSMEAFRVAEIYQAQYFNFTPLMCSAVLYLCVTIPLVRIVDHLQARKLQERGPVLALGAR